ncbi:MAG TPA: hypothetical protein PKI94_03900, partial [Candidatus Gastranaerophilaceae bacterium]|nr:hypothetical protein [Candidatus Gastranaerophilaceae bacterium]
KDFEITTFDNTVENIGISKRYNSYLEKLNKDDDFWIIFCHQDFGFEKNPYKKINSLNKKNIYGAIGTSFYYSPIRAIKKFLMKKSDEYSPFKRKFFGQIRQGQGELGFKDFGEKIFFEKSVSTLDCCCMIVHSSLINKYNLRFDENLDWHMYVEDFCINASKNHKIKLKAAQFNCFHLGEGSLNEDFFNCAKYVKRKYSLKNLFTTCLDG